MKKTVFLFLLFLSLALTQFLNAQQNSAIDSLNAIAQSNVHDTLRVTALKNLAWEFYFTNPANAPQYVRRMIAISTRARYIKGQWDGYNMMGVIHFSTGACDSTLYWWAKGAALSDHVRFHAERIYGNGYALRCLMKKGDFATARKIAEESASVAKKSGNRKSIIRAFQQMASVSYGTGDYQRCIAYYLKADSTMGNEISIDKGETLQNVAQIYHVLENTVQEKKYLVQARKVFEQLDDEYGVRAVELSEGNAALREKNFTEARQKFLSALSYFETINDRPMLNVTYRWVALSNYHLKDYTNALKYYDLALGKNPEIDRGDENLNSVYHELGRLYLDINQPRQAMAALETARTISETRGDLNMQVEVLRELARYHAITGDYGKAYQVQQRTMMLADSLNAIKSSKVLAETEAKHDTEKKQQTIELLQAEHALVMQEQKAQQRIFMVVAISALMIIVTLYFLFRIKHRTSIRLRQLDLLRSHFFSNISHEFRTPLTLILGPVENKLRKTDVPDHERRELESVHHQAKQLLGLVDQLLELSRLQSGGAKLRIEQGDPSSLMRATAASFEFMAGLKDIDYSVSISTGDHTMWYDRDALQKIMTNLLGNAFKYTPAKGTVHLECAFNNDHLHLVVANSGEGIPQELLGKIFDRFYQINGDAGGIGVGLALVRELAQLYRGQVTVESIPGMETRFNVQLPVARTLLAGATEISPSMVPDTITSDSVVTESMEELPVVLIVEDHSEIRSFIRQTLSPHFRCLEAEGGLAGKAVALEGIPDLIISDVMMPDLDGLSLCKQLKADERTSHIPLILLTARADDADALLGFETGADDYVVKPFSSDLLLVRIRKLIELRKALHARFSQEVVLRPQAIVLNSTDEQFLQKVQTVLDEHLTESDFSTERFSAEMGMSRMQLHRKLTGLTGMSANIFIRTHRLNMATDLLLTQGVNISEVGYRVGFSDPSYFARCFKEHFQCTPTEYIKRNVIAPA